MNEIKKLQELIKEFRDARDWKQFHNPKDVAISLVLEATEYLENFQWKNTEDINTMLATNKSLVSDELADVFYWVLLIASDLDIDLTEAVKAKLIKNNAKYPIEKAKGKKSKYTEF